MSSITFQRLSPERQSPQTNSASAGGACCCCCCCLHTVGGLIGAAVAPPPAQISSGPEASAGTLSARKPYWLSVLASCLLIIMFYPVLADESFEVGLFILVFFGPGVQLMASLFAALSIQSGDAGKRKLWHLGKMTLYSLLGSALGFGAMIVAAQFS